MSADRIIQPPPCAWCGDPATDQVHVGTGIHLSQTDSKPRRLYAYLCTPCARDAQDEKRRSQADE